MTTPHTSAPAREQREAVSVEELIEIFYREATFLADGVGNGIDPPEPELDMMAGVKAVRDAAIAAAEPHMRARHRAELYAELIAVAFGSYKHGMVSGDDVFPAYRWGRTEQWLRELQRAEATRPDGTEGGAS